jgi:hypothetical protein
MTKTLTAPQPNTEHLAELLVNPDEFSSPERLMDEIDRRDDQATERFEAGRISAGTLRHIRHQLDKAHLDAFKSVAMQ